MVLLLKNLLFTVLVPGTVAVSVPLLLCRGSSTATGPVLAVALCVLGFGTGIYAWCVWDFATFGRGTPAPIDAPKRLVVRGLYHYSRNPMYVGVLSVIVGWAILFLAGELILYAAIVGACFQLFVVFYEERSLQAQFGEDYERYCAQVPRWVLSSRHAPGRRG